MVCIRLMNEKTPTETVIKEINNNNNNVFIYGLVFPLIQVPGTNETVSPITITSANSVVGQNFKLTSYRKLIIMHFVSINHKLCETKIAKGP